MLCGKCKESVTDSVFCGRCDGNYHYTCAGLSESSYRRMGQEKKAAWRCAQCRIQPSNQGGGTDCGGSVSLADVLTEIKSLRADFNSMKSDFKDVQSDIRITKNCVEDLESKWCEMESRFSGVEDRLVVVEGKLASFSAIQKDLSNAQDTLARLQYENNLQDQFSRLNNVEISGVPTKNGENLFTLLQTLCTVVGFKLTDYDIDTIHRVRTYNTEQTKPTRYPSIIVRFSQRRRKDQLLAAVRARRGLTTSDIGMLGPATTLYVGDHLTPTNKLLLKRSRELKKEKNYSYLWVRDCKILLRKNDNANIIRISNLSDLNKIK